MGSAMKAIPSSCRNVQHDVQLIGEPFRVVHVQVVHGVRKGADLLGDGGKHEPLILRGRQHGGHVALNRVERVGTPDVHPIRAARHRLGDPPVILVKALNPDGVQFREQRLNGIRFIHQIKQHLLNASKVGGNVQRAAQIIDGDVIISLCVGTAGLGQFPRQPPPGILFAQQERLSFPKGGKHRVFLKPHAVLA